MEKIDILLEWYKTLLLWVEFTFATQNVAYQPKLWHLLFLAYNIKSDVFNTCIFTHIKPYFILLIIIMDQISSDLHGVIIQPTNIKISILKYMQILIGNQNQKQWSYLFFTRIINRLNRVNYGLKSFKW